jgi:hypothetical protein
MDNPSAKLPRQSVVIQRVAFQSTDDERHLRRRKVIQDADLEAGAL